MRQGIKLSVLVGVLAGVAVVAVACGGGSGNVACGEVDVTYSGGIPDLDGCELRVAVENAYPPFNFIDTSEGGTGEGIGYDYDFFNEFCDRANCTTEFVVTSWEAMLAIMAGTSSIETFDVGANGITITAERARNVDFSEPYFPVNEVLLVGLNENRFSTVDEFVADSNLRLATQTGTTNAITGVELVGEARITQTMQFGEAVQLLVTGDVDGVIIDSVAGAGYSGVNADQLMVLDDPVKSGGGLGFIFTRGSDLTAAVDWAISTFGDDGTLERLNKEWDPASG